MFGSAGSPTVWACGAGCGDGISWSVAKGLLIPHKGAKESTWLMRWSGWKAIV